MTEIVYFCKIILILLQLLLGQDANELDSLDIWKDTLVDITEIQSDPKKKIGNDAYELDSHDMLKVIDWNVGTFDSDLNMHFILLQLLPWQDANELDSQNM